MKKFVHSRACPYRNLPGPMPGYYYTEKDGFKVAKECDCHIQWRKQNALDIKLKNAGLEADFTFADYKGEKSLASFKALKEFTDNLTKKGGVAINSFREGIGEEKTYEFLSKTFYGFSNFQK